MREFEISGKLQKILSKLFKKDRYRYEIIMKKIDEIVLSEDIEHYKNLRSPMQHLKRVHINSSFVLTFKYDKTRDFVAFIDFDHHDNIYSNA